MVYRSRITHLFPEHSTRAPAKTERQTSACPCGTVMWVRLQTSSQHAHIIDSVLLCCRLRGPSLPGQQSSALICLCHHGNLRLLLVNQRPQPLAFRHKNRLRSWLLRAPQNRHVLLAFGEVHHILQQNIGRESINGLQQAALRCTRAAVRLKGLRKTCADLQVILQACQALQQSCWSLLSLLPGLCNLFVDLFNSTLQLDAFKEAHLQCSSNT